MNEGRKLHNVVVMDGSNKDTVKRIERMISEMIPKRHVHIRKTGLDMDHPTMIVLQYAASIWEQSDIKHRIETDYPALCNYDVAV